MGKGAPAAPNPVTTAAAQTASNRETAVAQAGLNAVNQVTPYGNLTYTQNGKWADGTPKFTATQTLSGAGQNLFNTGMQTQQNLANLAREQSGRLGSLLNNSLDFSGLPKTGSVVNGPNLKTNIANGGDIQSSIGGGDFSADRQRVEDAMFQRLNPQIDQQRQAFETSLVNRGIRPGSAAYDQQMGQFNQGVNDQRTSILLNAGQEQNRLQQLALNAGNFANSAQAQRYGQNANDAQFANSALQQMYANSSNQFNQQNTQRQNALQELIMQRQMPLNEILALAGQSQIQQPQFTATPQTGVAGTDVAGITNAAHAQNMQAYQQNQSALGGLFSAGASLIPLIPGLSDRRAKQNIKRIGTAFNGLPLFLWQYIGDDAWHVGPMAQDVQKVNPDAVSEGDNGLLYLDYAEAFA